MNEQTHIKPLTGMRFYAAMWVVLYHYWPNLTAAAPPAFVERGYLGVELFFVLSGFILCHVYLPAAERGGFKYGSFLWARIARVYPLHLATLLGVMALGVGATLAGFAIDRSILSWPSLPANLLMLHAWGLAPESAFNHPSWSISAEWFAYLTFPAFAWAALKLKSRPAIAAASAAALVALLYAIFPMLAGHPLTEATIAWGALRIVPCFALGCAAYLLWKVEVIRTKTAALGLSGLLIAAIAVMASLGAHDTPMVLTFGVLMVALASLTSTGSKVGTGRVGVWLGEVSYAVYMTCILWKLLFVNAVAKLLGHEGPMPLWLWLVFIAAVIPIAGLAHHLIERPARTWLKSIANRRRTPQYA